MTDQTVKIQEAVAKTALEMAKNLWIGKHGRSATADDKDFVSLVCTCSLALQGRTTQYSW